MVNDGLEPTSGADHPSPCQPHRGVSFAAERHAASHLLVQWSSPGTVGQAVKPGDLPMVSLGAPPTAHPSDIGLNNWTMNLKFPPESSEQK